MAKTIGQLTNEFQSDNPVTELVHDKKVDTVIGIPSWQGGIEPNTQLCLDKMCHFNISTGNHVSTCKAHGSIISENRNGIVRTAIRVDSDYILFMDTDMIFPPTAIQQMKAWNKPVVSALAFSKSYPFSPLMYDRVNDAGWKPIIKWKTRVTDEEPLMKVDYIASAFMLIKTSVFKKINPPWFASPSLMEHLIMQEADKLVNSKASDEIIVERMKKIMKEWGQFGTKDGELAVMGEDYYFSEKCRLNHIPIHVDTSLLIGHEGKFIYSYASFEAAAEQGAFDDVAADMGKIKKKGAA